MSDKFYTFFEMSLTELRTRISPLTKKYKDERVEKLGAEKQLMRVKAVIHNPKFTRVRFSVPSTEKKSKKYSVMIQVADVRPERFIEDMRNNDAKVSCTCKSFVWQGMAYSLSKYDASLNVVDIPDPIWSSRHGGEEPRVCKHLKGVLSSMNTFYPIIFGEIDSQIKAKMNKKTAPKKIEDIKTPVKDVRSITVDREKATKSVVGKLSSKKKIKGKFL